MDRTKDIKRNDGLTNVSCLAKIYRMVLEKGFMKEIMDELKPDFSYLEKMMGITPLEAALLAFILENGNGQNYGDTMKDYMHCSNIELLEYDMQLSSLVEKRILLYYEDDFNDCKYQVTDDARTAIAGNNPFVERDRSDMSESDIFYELRKLFKKLGQNNILPKHVLKDIHDILDANTDRHFVQCCEKSGIRECSLPEQLLFFFLCDRYISYDQRFVGTEYIESFVPFGEDSNPYRRGLFSGSLPCMKKGLVSMGSSSDMTDASEITLGAKVYEEFFTALQPAEQSSCNKSGLRHFLDIPKKEMFYNNDEKECVDRLLKLLEQDNLKAIQKRLEECGMRKGFNVILYGNPGTGKTETVLQIARATGRDIYEVDASKIRSKWVGESEKNIRSLFRTYTEMVRRSPIPPILLFNEADAVLSSRLSSIDSNSGHSHNAIQDIILEEMERMEGILICTTNMVGTLDEAFERRFIYKVKLSLPDKNTRVSLWESILPGLEKEQAARLADRYQFTGGNIENISRKSTVEYILTGDKVSFEKIESFCKEEKYSESKKKIGF